MDNHGHALQNPTTGIQCEWSAFSSFSLPLSMPSVCFSLHIFPIHYSLQSPRSQSTMYRPPGRRPRISPQVHVWFNELGLHPDRKARMLLYEDLHRHSYIAEREPVPVDYDEHVDRRFQSFLKDYGPKHFGKERSHLTDLAPRYDEAVSFSE